jgi:hypothetical protein
MQGSPRHANLSLLAGPLAAIILGVGIAGLALTVPGDFRMGNSRTVCQGGKLAGRRLLDACMAVSAAGVGVFAHPHPLHNVFGLSELIRLPGSARDAAAQQVR